MEAQFDVNDMSSPVNIVDCTTKVVPINDENYQTVIDWYKSCLKISEYLNPSQRDEYELSLIGNIKNALTSFFQRTELPLTTLIELEREISSMFEGLAPTSEIESKEQSDKRRPCGGSCGSCYPTCCDIEEEMKLLYKKLMWLAIASCVLLILLVLIFITLCWLRKCISQEMKDSFACCPSKEDTREVEHPSNNKSGSKKHSSKHVSMSYPARVWFNPLSWKQEETVKQ